MEEKKYTSNVEGVMIDLGDIIKILVSKIWFIILTGVMCALLAIAVSKSFITPMFQSTTKIYILNRADSSSLTYNDMSVSTSLAKDYSKLVMSRTVTENAISLLGLNMNSNTLLSRMEVSAESSDTRILSITVSDEDPYMACKIANTVREVAAIHISDVMDTDSVKVVEVANIPSGPSSPRMKLNAILGALVGMIISVLFIILNRMTNDRIITREDVEKYLGLSVLGTIPARGKRTEKKNRNKSKRRRK